MTLQDLGFADLISLKSYLLHFEKTLRVCEVPPNEISIVSEKWIQVDMEIQKRIENIDFLGNKITNP